MNSNSYVDVVAAEFGEEPGPDLVDAVFQSSDSALVDLCERLLNANVDHLSTPPSNEFWPLVTARSSTFNRGGGRAFSSAASASGLNLFSAIDPRMTGSGAFSNGVMRALLYCHGLAIEDPIPLSAELYLDGPAEMRGVARRSVEAAVNSVVELAPLIGTGIVETFFTPMSQQVSDRDAGRGILDNLAKSDGELTSGDAWDAFEAIYVDGLQPELAELWQRIRGGDREPDLDIVRRAAYGGSGAEATTVFIDIVAELEPQAVVENVASIVGSTASAAEIHGPGHDFLCPSPLFVDLLRLHHGISLNDSRLSELARLDVPGIGDLLTRDVVELRSDSEALDQWRRTLSLGLDRVQMLQPDTLSTADATSVVSDVVADARHRLFAEMRRSRVFGPQFRGLLSFVAGAIGGGLGGAMGGMSGIAVGAVGGAIPAAVSAISSGERERSWLLRHYLLFEPRRN